jgi:hypothetical protein
MHEVKQIITFPGGKGTLLSPAETTFFGGICNRVTAHRNLWQLWFFESFSLTSLLPGKTQATNDRMNLEPELMSFITCPRCGLKKRKDADRRLSIFL